MSTISNCKCCRPYFSEISKPARPRNRSNRIITLALILFLAVTFIGRTGSAAESPETSDDQDYIVGPRDVVNIKVWGEIGLSDFFEVNGGGTIPYFFLGDVHIAGLTPRQVRDKITALLVDGYLKDPIVIVRIDEYHANEVQIHGAVMQPGTYVLQTNTTTLSSLISMAGGTSDNRGKEAFIIRGGVAMLEKREGISSGNEGERGSPSSGEGDTTDKPGSLTDIPEKLKGQERIVVDLRPLLDHGVLGTDVTIYPGDFVLIGKISVEDVKRHYVFVEGAVNIPKKLEYHEGMTVLQAVIQCGGFDELASPNRTFITRLGPDGKPANIRVRLKDVQRGRVEDTPLQPGDRINVRESWF
jgi:polysaccharide export outer membrane protein